MPTGPSASQRRVLLEVTQQVADPAFFSGTTSVVNWIFPGEKLSVGRISKVGQMAIESDTALSKQHFEVSFDGGTCRLRDLNSANGTRVNGVRVDRIDIKDGDEITAGRTTFTVSILGGDGELQVPPPGNSTDQIAVPATETTAKSDDNSQTANPIEAGSAATQYRYAAIRVCDESEVDDLELASRMMAWLRAGQTITVGGSGMKADWKLKFDNQIAPAHFRLEFNGSRCVIQRLDASRPTLVNGQEIDRVVLKNDDRIKAGRTVFVVELA